MKKFPVSLDDIADAIESMPRDVVVNAIVVDHLGEGKRETEQFGRHVMAVKNQPDEVLIQAASKLAIKYSSSITDSNGCFLDKNKSTPIDFEGALTTKLEHILSDLDCSLSNSNPAAALSTARGIVRAWQESALGTALKHPLSNDDLSIEYKVGSTRVAITPSNRLPDATLMEATPILNELRAGLRTLSERKLGRSIPEQGLNM
jgi:hypothetical protein